MDISENPLLISDNPLAVKYLMHGGFYLPKERDQKNGISYIGSYKKELLLLLNEPLNTETQAQLQRILQFYKIKEEDYALLTPEDWGQLPIDQVVNHFKPKKIIAWGENIFPALPIYVVENIHGFEVVSCISLAALMKNNDSKKALMVALTEFLK